VAVSYLGPLVILALAAPLLGERVGRARREARLRAKVDEHPVLRGWGRGE
jgi:hypothetical protein